MNEVHSRDLFLDDIERNRRFKTDVSEILTPLNNRGHARSEIQKPFNFSSSSPGLLKMWLAISVATRICIPTRYGKRTTAYMVHKFPHTVSMYGCVSYTSIVSANRKEIFEDPRFHRWDRNFSLSTRRILPRIAEGIPLTVPLDRLHSAKRKRKTPSVISRQFYNLMCMGTVCLHGCSARLAKSPFQPAVQRRGC